MCGRFLGENGRSIRILEVEGPQLSERRQSLLGTRIGHLMIVDELGVGGMGRVYVAFDDRLQRQVALKAIRKSRLDDEARTRFLQEARILSQLRHPNICTIHGFLPGTDGDEGEADQDFLILELVDGENLGLVHRREGDVELDARDKLQVARAVASGLSAAHARGIVHRDLKPENVMVARGEQGLEVKILDFGLARVERGDVEGGDRDAEVAEPTSGEATVDTEEDAGSEPTPTSDGTASDPPPSGSAAWTLRESSRVHTTHGRVYGTVAYMSPEQARNEPISSATDVYSLGLILHELFTGESPYPKLPLNLLLVQVAQGKTRPATGIDGDLAQLIEDMKASRPEARPSMREVVRRLDRFAGKRRRRLRRLTVAAVLLLALLGVAKYTIDLRRERNAAVAARQAEEVSRRQAERVVEFMVGLFESSDPGEAQGEELTARSVLARGSRELREELEDDPSVRARLLEVVGQVQCRLGVYDEAEALLSEAVDLQRTAGTGLGGAAALASALDQLGRCHWEQDDYDAAEPLLLEALEMARGLGDETLLRDVRNSVGLLYWRRARYEEAAELLRQNLQSLEAAGAEPATIARVLNNLAEVLKGLGRLEEAESMLRRSLELKESVHGADHFELANTLGNLGELNYQLGRAEPAEEYLLRALGIYTRVFGDDHSRLVPVLNNLASLYDELGRSREALDLYLRARSLVEAEHGPRHLRIGIVDNNLGEVYLGLGRVEDARLSFERALSILRQALGDDHPHLAHPMYGLGRVSLSRGRSEEAREHYRLALEQRRKTLAEDHTLVQEMKRELAGLDGER